MTIMKKVLVIFAALALVCFSAASCQKVNLDGADTKTLTISYDLDGNSIANFSAAGEEVIKAVVINQGGFKRDIDWTVAVDNAPDWIAVEKTTVTTKFTGTYGGDDADVIPKAVKITVQPNTSGVKRNDVIRFTVADGGSISTTVTQNK